jgi:predicted DNA-binding transcriptional regulator AlpA
MERLFGGVTEPELNDQDALLVSAEKLAQLLDISIRTLWRLRAAGKLPAPVRLGGSVRWRVHEVQEWIGRGCPDESSLARDGRSRR